ncbi:aminotransferase class I/II-fold pyridoxal phosphate-dependent enzyme [Alicyclobacillus mengziensis]|uniref:PLP-dependent transferase n=1 Tax=Alicyclobacillus mengziensis TaxID=2931921 RepID=A0A9X7W0C0_9BACL|nr:aminotransferase class I/II-fold pyridoxal phosphate-dependent enzyme [Alicyclobacillus mengziensis]QSO47910.1 PLP-dependent transferase [Alicyclobacillus mengziensis]
MHIDIDVTRHMWSKEETPILTALIEMVTRHRLSLHVPGHKQGRLFPAPLATWLGQALKIDLTELPRLDNLHQPEGCIRESATLAASHYGAAKTLFCVNGSSAGVMAAVLGCAANQRILVAGGFHQSLWKGLVLADANPVILPTAFDWDNMEATVPSPEDVAMALQENEDVAAVFVTSPTYTGRIADVRGIAQAAHSYSIPLIVDEAHGAHFGITPELPEHSVQQGADVVIQSVHKMLPGLTQTAWLHLQGHYADYDSVQNALLMLQTSSPSYLLLASLDAAQAWLRLEGKQTVEESLRTMSRYPELAIDPARDAFRKWIPTASLDLSRDIAQALEEVGVWVEYADALGVLLIQSLDVKERDIERWLPVLRHRLSSPGFHHRTAFPRELKALYDTQSERCLVPREAELKRHERVHIRAARGRIAGRSIAPYPPGVPVVHPGQLLSQELISGLLWLASSGYGTVGLASDGTIEVVCE